MARGCAAPGGCKKRHNGILKATNWRSCFSDDHTSLSVGRDIEGENISLPRQVFRPDFAAVHLYYGLGDI
jgi:hypothetical protein